MSIRLRLTLWYVLVLCAGLALFAGAIIWQTEQSAHAALDDSLRRRARDIAADLTAGRTITLHADGPNESEKPGEATLLIRVLDGAGRVVVRQGPTVPGLAPGLLLVRSPGFHDGDAPHDVHVRLFVQAIMSGGRQRATIQVLTTTAPLEAARRQLLTAMGATGIAIALAATLGGLFLADRALRPVDRITRLAAQIGAGDLHRRVGDMARGRDRGGRVRRLDELGRLARTLDAMLARLDEASERRRRLTADAAHELATPIATIASAAEVALRRPRSAADYQATLGHVLDESRFMGRMVDDLLLLARADTGRLPLEHELVEIDEVCRVAVRAFQPVAVGRAITLTADLPPQAMLVMGDEVRLGQVLRNLLDNALRYTPSGGAVTLTLRACPPDGDGGHRLAVHVSDTGPGIPLGERERVFERFHRGVDRIDRRAGGSGLGLAICKAIVLAHGGQIRVADGACAGPDGPARGTTTIVVLPAATETTLTTGTRHLEVASPR